MTVIKCSLHFCGVIDNFNDLLLISIGLSDFNWSILLYLVQNKNTKGTLEGQTNKKVVFLFS